MKKTILYVLIMMSVLAAPVHGTDVGKLRPVQAISISVKNGDCVIRTDTGDRGIGKTGMEALANLKATTPAVIYLDTADYLLLGENADPVLEELRGRLKKNIRLCRVKEEINPKKAAEYLRVHKKLPRLKDWKTNENLPFLEHFGERLILLKKDGKKC